MPRRDARNISLSDGFYVCSFLVSALNFSSCSFLFLFRCYFFEGWGGFDRMGQRSYGKRERVITDCCYRWLLSVWLKLSSSIPSEGTRQWFLMMSFGKGASIPF